MLVLLTLSTHITQSLASSVGDCIRYLYQSSYTLKYRFTTWQHWNEGFPDKNDKILLKSDQRHTPIR